VEDSTDEFRGFQQKHSLKNNIKPFQGLIYCLFCTTAFLLDLIKWMSMLCKTLKIACGQKWFLTKVSSVWPSLAAVRSDVLCTERKRCLILAVSAIKLPFCRFDKTFENLTTHLKRIQDPLSTSSFDQINLTVYRTPVKLTFGEIKINYIEVVNGSRNVTFFLGIPTLRKWDHMLPFHGQAQACGRLARCEERKIAQVIWFL